MTTRIIAAAAAAMLVAACGAKPQGLQGNIQRTQLEGAQADQYKQLVEAGDAAWEQRADRAQLETAIAKWEEAIQIKDDDADTYYKLSRANYLLADGHLAFDEAAESAFLATHEKGYTYAERGLAALSKEFEKRVRAGTNIEDAIKVVGREGAAHMYWYASNLGKWGNAQGITTVLRYKERIFKIVSRVHEVAPDYFHGASDRYFGAFYAIAPPFAGGDLEKSYEHFNASLKKAPNYLGTYVLMAEHYATKAQEPEAFERALRFVLDAPLDSIPGLEPEAAVEKKKAELLLAKKDDLF